MSRWIRFAGVLSAFLSLLIPLKLKDKARALLLWIPRVVAGALSPVLALQGGMAAIWGLTHRDWLSAIAGACAVAVAGRYLTRVTAPHDGFERAFGPSWERQIAPAQGSRMLSRRWDPVILSHPPAEWIRDIVFGVNPETRELLRADLWLPAAGPSTSGLAVIYVHGGAWHIGTKNMGTGYFMRRLAGQGHVVMDIEYTLAPRETIPGMTADVKRAIIWLKERATEYGIDPQRIVLMGGSAGGHLALLAAYTPNHSLFQPAESSVDTSVRGVVSFYGPTDLEASQRLAEATRRALTDNRKDILSKKLVERILNRGGFVSADATGVENVLTRLVGATPQEDRERYRLLSPVHHVGPQCPPSLLLQGATDVFGMAPNVRQLHERLQAAGSTSILVEFPDTDHAFDLVLPRLSPPAQAAIYDVERFLALLV